MSTPSLEKRIAAALVGDDVSSANLSALTAETETAISQADATAEAERIKALDPALSPDAKAAREAMQAAEFSRYRLRTVLPRLRGRLQQADLHERYCRWLAEFERVKPRHDAAVARLKAIYLELEAKLVDALSEAQEVDAEVKRLCNEKPYDAPEANGDGCNLLTVEFAARGITGVGLYGHSIMNDLKLPTFSDPTKLAWPPPQVPLGVLMAQGMAPAAHPGGDWWQHNRERGQAMREEHERLMADYAAQARAREEREAAEDKERTRAR